MARSRWSAWRRVLVGCAAGVLTGCVTIGPQTITRDRSDYGSAIARSWQDQMLLNFVKLRYGDTPVFLEVASVISQYSLEGQVDLSAGFNSSIIGSDTQAIGGAGRYAERPTITYAPLFGQRFVQSLMQPVPPVTVFSLAQGGWPIDFIFLVLVRTINGLHNQSSAQLYRRDADPDFVVLLQALRRLQESEAIGIQLRRSPGLRPQRRDDHSIDARAARGSLKVDVPSEDIESGRTVASPPRPALRGSDVPGLLRIHSGSEAPAGAFVAVPYGRHWF